MFRLIASLLLAAALFPASGGRLEAQPTAVRSQFLVEPMAERIVERLPEGPLHWRIETFPSLAEAVAAAGPLSLTTAHAGRFWLFTLGQVGELLREARGSPKLVRCQSAKPPHKIARQVF